MPEPTEAEMEKRRQGEAARREKEQADPKAYHHKVSCGLKANSGGSVSRGRVRL